MRDIIFNGKREDNGEWVEGFLIDSSTISQEGHWYPVCPETIGQYIGCRDKYKVKVFEGNIVRNGDDEYFVFWDEQSLSWALQGDGVIYSIGELCGYEVEVIGTVHEKCEER